VTRFGPEAGSQSLQIDGGLSRSIAGSQITDVTPFSFIWDWSPVFPGNSRFGDFEIQADTGGGLVRIAKFGGDVIGGTDTRLFAYGLVNNASTLFQSTDPGLQPVLSVNGYLNFNAQTYDISFTNVTTNAFYSFTGLKMITQPTTAQAATSATFAAINVEGNHYIDNLSVGGPAPTSFTWHGTSGDWNVVGNWFPGASPNANTQTAIFGSAITLPQTVYTNSAVTVKGIQFGDANDGGLTQSYAIAGQGSVTMASDTGTSTINVIDGTHQFQTVLNLGNATTVSVAASSSLALNNALNLNGNTLTKTGTGTLQINNVLNAGGGTVVGQGGTIAGSGLVSDDLSNTSAKVAPGIGVGKLSVGGDYSQGAGGTLQIEIGGRTVGTQYDQLAVVGSATLGGALGVSLVNLGSGVFMPALNDTFTILSAAAGRTGAFTTTAAGLPALGGGLAWQINYGANNVVLSVISDGVPGDYNNNGVVDAADYVVWRKHPASLTHEGASPGVVDAADYNFWREHFGSTSGSGSSLNTTAVPEPATCGLMLTTLSALAMISRKRKSL
jgi:hypothetical protein